MDHFCRNPKCQYYDYYAREDEHSMSVMKGDNVKQEIYRHIYTDGEKNLIRLCSICHNAIKIIMKPKNIEA